jgi:hypothetical protein
VVFDVSGALSICIEKAKYKATPTVHKFKNIIYLNVLNVVIDWYDEQRLSQSVTL